MLKNKYRILASMLLLTCFLYSLPLPNWSEIVVEEAAMPSKGNAFTVKAYEFMQNKEYKKFVTHEGIAGKSAFLQGGLMVIENRSYFTPEFIPTNVPELSKYDVIRVYSLFNVAYYIEKIDQDIRSILADVMVPPNMETVQATILTCVYNKSIIDKETFSLYVYGNKELADNFNFYKGQPVGSTILEDINYGTTLPETPPTVMVIGQETADIKNIIQYCQENNVLTITNHAKFLTDGVTVGIGTVMGNLKILLNTKGADGESSNWNQGNIFYKKI